MSYVFKKIKDEQNPYDTTTVIVKIDTVTLGDLLEGFEDFLRACGYQFKGNLNIVDEYDATLKEEEDE